MIAAIKLESGGDRVRAILYGGAVISSVNFAEVYEYFRREGVSDTQTEAVLDGLHLVVVPFDRAAAKVCGALAAQTKPFGIGIADRACLATALNEGFIAVTADRSWARLDIGVEIEVIR